LRAALLMIGLLLGGVVAAQQAEPEEPTVLPDGPGREETFYACISCHSTAIIRRQGMTRAQWDGLMDWMTEKHGMTPLEGTERQLIVDYLAQSFPPRRRAPRNPFAD
jgi:hypothetical protein